MGIQILSLAYLRKCHITLLFVLLLVLSKLILELLEADRATVQIVDKIVRHLGCLVLARLRHLLHVVPELQTARLLIVVAHLLDNFTDRQRVIDHAVLVSAQKLVLLQRVVGPEWVSLVIDTVNQALLR